MRATRVGFAVFLASAAALWPDPAAVSDAVRLQLLENGFEEEWINGFARVVQERHAPYLSAEAVALVVAGLHDAGIESTDLDAEEFLAMTVDTDRRLRLGEAPVRLRTGLAHSLRIADRRLGVPSSGLDTARSRLRAALDARSEQAEARKRAEGLPPVVPAGPGGTGPNDSCLEGAARQ